jgi:flagella basal body P-ring formation protein FlgA
MNNGNPRPLSKKKQVQLMIALTILAWATQTLRHQWGFGAEVQFTTPDSVPQNAQAANSQAIDSQPTDSEANSSTGGSAQSNGSVPTSAPSGDADDAISGKETFVPGEARFANGATLEVRSEATIVGAEIKLKQICRWSDEDKPVFAPVADFIVARIKPGSPFLKVTITDLKSTLHDAGISCTIARSDTAYDEQTALSQWIDAKQGNANEPATQPSAVAPVQPNGWADAAAQGVTVLTVAAGTAIPASATIPASNEEKQYHTLRELLTRDLATRTNLTVDQLQMNFRAQDEKVLNLSEPNFKFQIDPLRARNLGNVSWSVTILASGESNRITINAEGRAWQKQLVLTRPLESREVIQPADFVEQRTLVDSLPNEPLLSRDQMVNEQAAQQLKPGTVLSARMVDSVPLVKAGQFVTISVTQGAVQIKTVATAMEAGSYGQTIRVRNEETRDIFEVTMTGPQTATMNSVRNGNPSGDSSSAPVAAAQ